MMAAFAGLLAMITLLLGGVAIVVNSTDAPTAAPTQETFVLSYAGSVDAGFGGSYEGNEVTIPFVASPVFDKEIAVSLNDCSTPISDDLMNATFSEQPVGDGGNLTHYNVSLALNLTGLAILKSDAKDDALWNGTDVDSNVLTFCVTVDLMTDRDIVDGDEYLLPFNKTSVMFERVLVSLEIDFYDEIPVISNAEAVPQVAKHEIVAAEVYGATGCHCNTDTITCLDDTAPALTIDDTMDVCFSVAAKGVSIAQVTSFVLTQDGLSFDAVQAGPDMHIASYGGSSAIFRSRLPSPFFNGISSFLNATATVELSFSSGGRRLVGSSASSFSESAAGTLSLWNNPHRNIQEASGRDRQQKDVAVQINVDAVLLASKSNEHSHEDDDEEESSTGASSLVIVLVSCVGLLAIVAIALFLLRKHRKERKQVKDPSCLFPETKKLEAFSEAKARVGWS